MKKIRSLVMAATFAALVGCANNSAVAPTAVDEISLNSAVLGAKTDIAPFMLGHHLVFDVLNLSEDQQAQIQAIFESHREEIKSNWVAGAEKPSAEERKSTRLQMRKALREKIKAVLTAEQQTKAEALKAQLKQGQIPEEIIDAKIARLDAHLSLSDDQKQQIKSLQLQRPSASPAGEKIGREFRKEKRSAMQAHKEKLFAILTPQQQAILNELAEERGEKFQGRFRGKRGNRFEGRVARLVSELGLDQQQQEQLEQLFANLREEFLELRESGDKETIRETMREKMSQIDPQIQTILTAEQYEKYQELKASRLDGHGPRFGGRRG